LVFFSRAQNQIRGFDRRFSLDHLDFRGRQLGLDSFLEDGEGPLGPLHDCLKVEADILRLDAPALPFFGDHVESGGGGLEQFGGDAADMKAGTADFLFLEQGHRFPLSS
jgi:hypothetical protein